MGIAPSVKKVLLVDDEADFRQLLKEIILENFEANIFEASDGIEAVHQLGHDEFSLVITDLNMPRLTGTELLKSIQTNQNMYHIKMRTALPHLILMSGSIDSEFDESLNTKDIRVKIFAKPFDTNELIRELGTHLQMKK